MKRRIPTFVLQSLASVVIAFAIWLIAKQNDTDTSWVPATVTLVNVPNNVLVTSNPEKIKVNLQYPREMNNQIIGKDLNLDVNVSDFFSADPRQWPSLTEATFKDYKPTPADLRKMVGLEMVQVLETDPGKIVLRGEVMLKELAIEVRTTGTLSNKFLLTGPLKPDREKIKVTGTRAELDKISKVQTEVIDLSAVNDNKQAYLRLLLPSGVRPIDNNSAQVGVAIGITEKTITQDVTAVPINYLSFSGLESRTIPQAVDVTISGPASAVAAISAADISFTPVRDLPEVVGKRYDVGIEAHLKNSVALEISQQIVIRGCRPAVISVEFLKPSQQNSQSTHSQ